MLSKKSHHHILRETKKRFNVVYNNVSDMVEDKQYAYELFKHTNQYPHKNYANLIGFIKKYYFYLTVINICREIDDNPRWDTSGFISLLKYIRKNYTVYTFSWFSKKYPDWVSAEKDFRKFVTGKKLTINRRSIDLDIREIKNAVKHLKKYRDKKIAHIERRKYRLNATIQDMLHAIDLLEQKVIKYNLLINQAYTPSLLPVNFEADFDKVFK